ncbi:MAG: hypothetical protein AAB804_01920 [Patescibacteria group bacterium]
MSNVLPRDMQKTVWRMYRARFIVAGSLIALGTALIAGLALLPIYVALHAGEVSTSASSREVKNSEVQAVRTEILRAQSLLSTLAPFAPATTTPSEAIGAALSLRPKGILVDRISYTPDIRGEIVIVGLAPTRDAINVYRQTLQADRHFKTVSVPIGDLAGTQDGRFSVTLLGDF